MREVREEAREVRPKIYGLGFKRMLSLSGGVVALDLGSKWLAREKGIAIFNRGGAFSLFGDGLSFGLVPLMAMMVLVLYISGQRHLRGRKMLGSFLVLGGGLGNLISRLAWGSVVDFVRIGILPVFNLADVAVCAGIGMFVCDELRKGKYGT